MFKVEIETRNAAFADRDELMRCFERVLNALSTGSRRGPVIDTNGNRVGRFEVVED